MQTMFGSTARSARPRYCPTWKLGKSDRVISAEKSGSPAIWHTQPV